VAGVTILNDTLDGKIQIRVDVPDIMYPDEYEPL
jgi:hypothetical protein